MLLEAGADRFLKDSEGRSPLDMPGPHERRGPRRVPPPHIKQAYERKLAKEKRIIADLIRRFVAPRRLQMMRWRRALDAHRDATRVFNAARDGRPMELDKRLRLGKLAGGLDIKGESRTGRMVLPMHAAISGGHMECVEVLRLHASKKTRRRKPKARG